MKHSDTFSVVLDAANDRLRELHDWIIPNTPDRHDRQCMQVQAKTLEAAIKAASQDEPAWPCVTAVLEGGIVQCVVSDRPESVHGVLVIDYDTDGAGDEELALVPQDDGSLSEAIVYGVGVTKAAIDLHNITAKEDCHE